MTLVEWAVRALIKLVATAIVVAAVIGASLMGLDAIIPKLMARHYAVAGMFSIAMLSAFVGTLPLALGFERGALTALGCLVSRWRPDRERARRRS
jgi:predicted cobalt transporter CbtA